MPENPEKKLGSFVVETRSSDGVILKTIEGLRREISATIGEPAEAVIAEVFSPMNVASPSGANAIEKTNVTDFSIAKLTHKDSATGLYLQQDRNLKKVA